MVADGEAGFHPRDADRLWSAVGWSVVHALIVITEAGAPAAIGASAGARRSGSYVADMDEAGRIEALRVWGSACHGTGRQWLWRPGYGYGWSLRANQLGYGYGWILRLNQEVRRERFEKMSFEHGRYRH
ncbi:MAG: hypothetical protein WBP94_15770 [Rhodomicrobiaceae bacterium]